MSGLLNGIVTKSTGSWYFVRTPSGDTWPCRMAGKYRLKDTRSTNPISVGDKVSFLLSEDQEGLITDRSERHSEIVRRSRKLTSRYHVIAANVDQLVVIATFSQPRTSTGFIDRLLVSAEISDIPGIVVFNKKDLWKPAHQEKYSTLHKIYTQAGYQVLATSSQTGEGINELKSLLANNKSLLAGHSGAGKSSLINSINPTLNLHTKPVSKATQKGMHATTHAEMHFLIDNTWIIDSPGIRDFGILDVDKAILSHYFAELKPYTGQCRFNDCLHQNEPGCIIKQKVQEGLIPELRFDSYLRILNNMY